MNKYIASLFIILIVSITNVFSQADQGSLGIKGSVKVDRTAMQGAKLIVIKNGVKEKTYTSDAKGKFEFSIDLNAQYEIVVAKQGYYSKKLSFNTRVPKDEVGIWSYKFVMTMIPTIDGFDASLLDKPIGKIMYVDKVGEFDYNEAYTFNMLKKLEALMKAYEKARTQAYKKIIAQADAAFNNKDYDLSVELYDKAIDLDPYETYPDDQIVMIGKIIHQDENAEKNYAKNIAEADKYFKSIDYPNAKKYYNRALNYLSNPYPEDQLALIEKILNDKDAQFNEQQAKEKAYTEAIAAGDRLFTSKQYENAVSKYTEALNIKPKEQYPKDKLVELNVLIAQLAKNKKSKEEIEKQYRAAIALADKGFSGKDYIASRSNYVKASQIKPAETYPRTKITEIDNILAGNKSLNEKYNGFIAVADKSFLDKEYQSAKNNYQQALSIKPNEAYPASKIKEIDALLLQLAQQKKKDVEGNYLRLIALADASFNKKEYEAAKTGYSQALVLKAGESYPKQRIIEIDEILNELAKKKHNYDMAIARADNNFNIDKWKEAKVDYQLALSIFPNEQYPQTRINEIENKLLALKSANEQKAARDNAYNNAIAKADALFTEKKYQESKNSYTQALAVKPTEAYPKQRITEIDKLLNAQKVIDDRYNSVIAAADQHFLNKKYVEARAAYTNASLIKKQEAYPKQKIVEIDKLLASQKEANSRYFAIIAAADGHFNNKKYNDAKTTYTNALQIKPNEEYPKKRISEIDRILASQKSLNDKYLAAIATADQYFLNEKYNEAKATYTNALQIKQNEAYPKQKITEIDALLNQIMAAKAKYEQNKKQYDNTIAQADAQFNSKTYVQAKTLYQKASTFLPDEVYPKQRIVEIDNLLSGIADKDRRYKESISAADKLFASKSYGEALALYNTASGIKPEEQYPKGKIIEINTLLEKLQKNAAAYDNYIKLADAAYSSNNLEQAKGQYQAALAIKQTEAYPKQRIAEIDKLLAEQARLASEREKIESQYKTLITNADLNFNQKKYQQAKNNYSQASLLKPNEMYPKERIAEIDNITETLAAQQKAYKQKIAEGESLLNNKNFNGALSAYKQASQIMPNEVLPKQKISEIQAIIDANAKTQEQYKNLVSQANSLFNKKSYKESKTLYQQAGALLPNEAYPKNQIVKIDALIADAAKREAELQALMKSYNEKIDEAGKLFDSKNYNGAISAYMDAKFIKSDETFPDKQIVKIKQILKDKAAQIEADYNKAMALGDKLKNTKEYIGAKQQYTTAINLKPNDAAARAKLVEIDNLIEKDMLAKQKQAKTDADYNKFIKQADATYKTKNYSTAIALYKSAGSLKPNEKYPINQIEICERKIQEQKAFAAAEENKRKQAELAASQSSFKKGDFDYSGEKRNQKFLNELSKQYPEGVTVEHYEKKNKKIKRVIVNRNGIAKEYIEVKYSYGTFYFRNGQNISRTIFYSETKK